MLEAPSELIWLELYQRYTPEWPKLQLRLNVQQTIWDKLPLEPIK